MSRPTSLATSLCALSLCSGLFTGSANAEVLSQKEISDSHRQHSALAQLYRWYQFYEEPRAELANQLDILAPTVKVKSTQGEAVGHEQYIARVAQLPKSWHNAHHVRKAEATVDANGQIALNAAITYQNQGMNPDGSMRSAELNYTTHLVPTNTVLPRFDSIEIAAAGEGSATAFADAYPTNRAASLLHYWLALIEDPRRDPEPVREILANGFSLNFSSGAISTFDGFKQWLKGPGSSVTASKHAVRNLQVTGTGKNTYRLEVDFDWNGLLPNGQQLSAQTHHTWDVINDPTERFARIQTMNVKVVQPFAPAR